jgi:hypothetical protein
VIRVIGRHHVGYIATDDSGSHTGLHSLVFGLNVSHKSLFLLRERRFHRLGLGVLSNRHEERV